MNGKANTNIGLVFDNLELSGADKVAVNLLRRAGSMPSLNLRGFVCMDDRLGCAGVADNIAHLTSGMQNLGSLVFRTKKALIATIKLRRAAQHYDVLVAVTPPAAILATLATVFTRCKVVPWVHYDMDGISRERPAKGRRVRDMLQKTLYTRIVPAFRTIIFVSESTRASFVRRTGARQPGWHVLPNVLDEAPFLPRSESTTFVKADALALERAPLLLFLGRIFRQKRWEDAISAADCLAARGWKFNMAFVGDGIERQSFLQRIETSRAARHLHYLGPDPNPLPTLNCAAALILTSLYEAWPTVILEANLANIPVLSYDCPSGPREMLGQNERGIVTRESPEALAQGIINYFSLDATAKTAMLARAHDFAARFLPEAALPEWEAALIKIARKRKNG
jgi:glycosyltransferase involved in cell wall biosynthesis